MAVVVEGSMAVVQGSTAGVEASMVALDTIALDPGSGVLDRGFSLVSALGPYSPPHTTMVGRQPITHHPGATRRLRVIHPAVIRRLRPITRRARPFSAFLCGLQMV
jgi:hypothetical protein